MRCLDSRPGSKKKRAVAELCKLMSDKVLYGLAAGEHVPFLCVNCAARTTRPLRVRVGSRHREKGKPEAAAPAHYLRKRRVSGLDVADSVAKYEAGNAYGCLRACSAVTYVTLSEANRGRRIVAAAG